MNNSNFSFQEALLAPVFSAHKSPLSFISGTDSDGNVFISDLKDLPHLMIAGATGTGKSTLVHHIILSIAMKSTPKDVRFLLCDTKLLEFSRYDGLPHLLIPPVTDERKVAGAIAWATTELTRRLKVLRDKGCRSIVDYNNLQWEDFLEEMPYLVIIVDDAAVVIQNTDVKADILKITQSGRSVGVHLVLITQSPSSRYLSDIIKAAIPARAVFNVLTKNDEKLLLDAPLNPPISEIGSMIFYDAPAHIKKPIQCFYISDYCISSIVSETRELFPVAIDPTIEDQILCDNITNTLLCDDQLLSDYGSCDDELFSSAVEIILETGQASVSTLQRRLRLGYAKSARIIDEMEKIGIVGPFRGSKPRTILITKEQWSAMHPESSIQSFEDSFVENVSEQFDEFDSSPVQSLQPLDLDIDSSETETSSSDRKWYHQLRDLFKCK